MTVQAAGVGTTVAATVLGVSVQRGASPGPAAVRDQLALTGVGYLEILVVLALVLVLAGVLLTGLVRRHAGAFEPPA
ncbi:MAG: hypothetical protein WKF43_01335 [Acidimicrobiales bacterium]